MLGLQTRNLEQQERLFKNQIRVRYASYQLTHAEVACDPVPLVQGGIRAAASSACSPPRYCLKLCRYTS